MILFTYFTRLVPPPSVVFSFFSLFVPLLFVFFLSRLLFFSLFLPLLFGFFLIITILRCCLSFLYFFFFSFYGFSYFFSYSSLSSSFSFSFSSYSFYFPSSTPSFSTSLGSRGREKRGDLLPIFGPRSYELRPNLSSISTNVPLILPQQRGIQP